MALSPLSGARNPNSSKGSQSQVNLESAIRMNNEELRLANILLTSDYICFVTEMAYVVRKNVMI